MFNMSGLDLHVPTLVDYGAINHAPSNVQQIESAIIVDVVHGVKILPQSYRPLKI